MVKGFLYTIVTKTTLLMCLLIFLKELLNAVLLLTWISLNKFSLKLYQFFVNIYCFSNKLKLPKKRLLILKGFLLKWNLIWVYLEQLQESKIVSLVFLILWEIFLESFETISLIISKLYKLCLKLVILIRRMRLLRKLSV